MSSPSSYSKPLKSGLINCLSLAASFHLCSAARQRPRWKGPTPRSFLSFSYIRRRGSQQPDPAKQPSGVVGDTDPRDHPTQSNYLRTTYLHYNMRYTHTHTEHTHTNTHTHAHTHTHTHAHTHRCTHTQMHIHTNARIHRCT